MIGTTCGNRRSADVNTPFPRPPSPPLAGEKGEKDLGFWRGRPKAARAKTPVRARLVLALTSPWSRRGGRSVRPQRGGGQGGGGQTCLTNLTHPNAIGITCYRTEMHPPEGLVQQIPFGEQHAREIRESGVCGGGFAAPTNPTPHPFPMRGELLRKPPEPEHADLTKNGG